MRGALFSFVCATVRNHLRSRAPESPGFFFRSRVSESPEFSYCDLPGPMDTSPLLKDDYTSFWGVPFN